MAYGGSSLQDWLDDGVIPELTLAGRVAWRAALAHMLLGLQAMRGVVSCGRRALSECVQPARWLACAMLLPTGAPAAAALKPLPRAPVLRSRTRTRAPTTFS